MVEIFVFTIPSSDIWIAALVVVAFIVIFIIKGFIEEMKR